MNEQESTGKAAKRHLRALAILVLLAAAFFKLFGHGLADWRLILGMILFGSVMMMMMSWSYEVGMIKAKQISEKIFAEHKRSSGREVPGHTLGSTK